jgi:EmrB/QacA subfamily drug resistance transporter
MAVTAGAAEEVEPAHPVDRVAMGSARGRFVLLATVLGSGMASLDATVVNIALPAIGRDLGAPLSSLQWLVTAYALTLASLLLLGGTLGDRYGRRRVFLTGVGWFTLASLGCGLAWSAPALIAARALQGVGGALLTPGSLAILQSTFRREDRGAAVGAWSGLGGVATALGPFAGGYLIQAVSWRLIFLLNLPLALVVVLVAARHVPETRDAEAAPRVDLAGAVLAALGLGGLTYALIELPGRGAGHPAVLAAAALGAGSLLALLLVEHRSPHPMIDVRLFRSRQWSGANLETFVLYAALGGAFFLLPIELQLRLGYSPLGAGVSMLPVTLVMLLLSARMGRLSQRVGPRAPMTVGPLLCGGGLWLLSGIGAGGGYFASVLPPLLLFSLGLAVTVAPLTATVLAAAIVGKEGLASAINNCIARTGGLVAVAVLPLAAGLASAGALDGAAFDAGFRRGMRLAATLAAAGAVTGWLTIRNQGTPLGKSPPLDPARAIVARS